MQQIVGNRLGISYVDSLLFCRGKNLGFVRPFFPRLFFFGDSLPSRGASSPAVLLLWPRLWLWLLLRLRFL